MAVVTAVSLHPLKLLFKVRFTVSLLTVTEGAALHPPLLGPQRLPRGSMVPFWEPWRPLSTRVGRAGCRVHQTLGISLGKAFATAQKHVILSMRKTLKADFLSHSVA